MHPTIFSNSSYTVDYFLTITLNEVVEILESEYVKQVDDKQKEKYLKYLSWELYQEFHSIEKIRTEEEKKKRPQRGDEVRLWAKLKEKLPNEYLNEYMLDISSTYYLEVKFFIYGEFGKNDVHKRRTIFADFLNKTPLDLQPIFLNILRREAVSNRGGNNPHYRLLEECVNEFLNKRQQEPTTVKGMKIDNGDLLNLINEIIEKFDKSYKENQETASLVFANSLKEEDIDAIISKFDELYSIQRDNGFYAYREAILKKLSQNNQIARELLEQIQTINKVFYNRDLSVENTKLSLTEKNVKFKENVKKYLNSLNDINKKLYAIKGDLEIEMGIISVSIPITDKNKTPNMPKKIFVSYCSADRNLRQIMEQRLKIYLKSTKNKFDAIWTDKEIQIGDDWNSTIQDALDSSTIGILLVSPMFLGSDYCMADELKKMLDRRKSEGYLIIPILLRECNFFNDDNLKAMQFFKTYQSEYDINDLLRKDKLMPFDELADVPNPQERLLNRYFQKLANDIDVAVTKQLSKNT